MLPFYHIALQIWMQKYIIYDLFCCVVVYQKEQHVQPAVNCTKTDEAHCKFPLFFGRMTWLCLGVLHLNSLGMCEKNSASFSFWVFTQDSFDSDLFVEPRTRNHNLRQGALQSVKNMPSNVLRPLIRIRKKLSPKKSWWGKKKKPQEGTTEEGSVSLHGQTGNRCHVYRISRSTTQSQYMCTLISKRHVDC